MSQNSKTLVVDNFIVKEDIFTRDYSVHNDSRKEGDSLLDYCDNLILMDLKYERGHIPIEVNSRVISQEDKGKIISFVIETKYKYRQYTGKDYGNVLVYSLPIEYPSTDDAWQRYESVRKEGIQYVQTLIPEATLRVGCNCCYGTGPDISVVEDEENGLLLFEVDFEFDLEDHL